MDPPWVGARALGMDGMQTEGRRFRPGEPATEREAVILAVVAVME